MINASVILNSSLLKVYQDNSSLLDSRYIAQVCYLPNLTVERMLVLMLGFWFVAEIFALCLLFWNPKSGWALYVDQFLKDVAFGISVLGMFVALYVLYLHDPQGFFSRNRLLFGLGVCFLTLLGCQIVRVLFGFWRRKRKPVAYPGEKVP